MSKKTFSVFEKSLSQMGEPELVSSGLSFEEARDLAGAKIGDFIAHWSCNFDVRSESRENGSHVFEAVKLIPGSSLSWGYRVTIEPEPESDPERDKMLSKRFSLWDVLQAFGSLEWNLQIEGAKTETDRFLLSDIESDIRKILSGEIVISESGEFVYQS